MARDELTVKLNIETLVDGEQEEMDYIRQAIREKRERDKADTVYLCDRRACSQCSYPQCKHTRDISHAVSFARSNSGAYVQDEAQPVELAEM